MIINYRFTGWEWHRTDLGIDRPLYGYIHGDTGVLIWLVKSPEDFNYQAPSY